MPNRANEEFTGLLFLEIAGQEGCDQFPEFRCVVPVLLPGQPESQPFGFAEDVGGFGG
jgi:hypothetical protein